MTEDASTLKILIITAGYHRSSDNPSLYNDLASQFSRDGHAVTVVAVDWAGDSIGAERYREADGTEVLFVAPPRLRRRSMARRALRFVTVSFLLQAQMKRFLRDRSFDLIVTTAPLTNMMAMVRWALRRFRCRSYAHVTDMFPYHHRQIGVMPGGFTFRVALAIETALLRMHDVIGCMSPMNLDYLRSHYALGGKTRAEVLSLWGPTDRPAPANRQVVREKYALPIDRSIVIYGGQLSAGRGFDEVLGAARLAAQQRPDLFFLIIGQGPLAEEIALAAADNGNIAVEPRIPREEYLTLLAACDVGIVCTVPGVDVPTFPSKTIDLLRAGVPIAASVERTTDYADFVRDNQVGVAVEAGSAERLLGAITAIVDDPDRARGMKAAAGETLDRVFDVAKVSRRLIAQSFPERAG